MMKYEINDTRGAKVQLEHKVFAIFTPRFPDSTFGGADSLICLFSNHNIFTLKDRHFH